MRLLKTYDFNGIKGFKLGWSPFGSPLMTTFCYILGDLMIDTGLSHMRKEVLALAEKNRVKRIVLTHHHEDHSGNAAALKEAHGAKVYGHALTIEKLARPFRIRPYQTYVWGKSRPLKVEPLPEKIGTILGPMASIHTPGHSTDHTAFLLEEAGILFPGDLYLADRIKYFRADECLGTEIESLERILKLEFDMLLCSHFPRAENGQKRIRAKLAFLQDLYGAIVALWEKGLSEKEIFKALGLKENHITRMFCLGNVSMMNGLRSVLRHYKNSL